MALRYGENPHQAAALYRVAGEPVLGLGASAQLHGPELSFNNLLDASAALGLVLEFDEPAAVVIKHTNPCGAAVGAGAAEAMRRAKASDPVSIYGGIVAVNRPVDMEVVEELAGILLEVLFAPSYEPDALAELRRTKKKCRVLRAPTARRDYPSAIREVRSVLGGLLVQEADLVDLDPGRAHGREQAAARRRRAARPALRVAGRQARQVERDRARHRRAGGRGRRGPDEPGRLGAARGDAGARAGPRDPRRRLRLRRVLSLPRRPRRGGAGRAPPRRSSPAARSATRRWSPPPTSTGWPW